MSHLLRAQSLEVLEDYLGLKVLNPLNTMLLGFKTLRPR
jgi:hypothetical protein